MDSEAERASWEFDEEGFHRTRTLDHTVALDGPVNWVLDRGPVHLDPHDVVVWCATRHVWRDNGDEPMRR
ncbi:hypothetical protein ACWEN3_04855 [Streptomyces sp. NPDC004561]